MFSLVLWVLENTLQKNEGLAPQTSISAFCIQRDLLVFFSASREKSPDSVCSSRAQVIEWIFEEGCCGRIEQAGLQCHGV